MWKLKKLIEHSNSCHAKINGKWVPARPINYKYRSFRIKIREAWQVFSGKADTFVWPEDQ